MELLLKSMLEQESPFEVMISFYCRPLVISSVAFTIYLTITIKQTRNGKAYFIFMSRELILKYSFILYMISVFSGNYNDTNNNNS